MASKGHSGNSQDIRSLITPPQPPPKTFMNVPCTRSDERICQPATKLEHSTLLRFISLFHPSRDPFLSVWGTSREILAGASRDEDAHVQTQTRNPLLQSCSSRKRGTPFSNQQASGQVRGAFFIGRAPWTRIRAYFTDRLWRQSLMRPVAFLKYLLKNPALRLVNPLLIALSSSFPMSHLSSIF